jgi:hypothetical protein
LDHGGNNATVVAIGDVVVIRVRVEVAEDFLQKGCPLPDEFCKVVAAIVQEGRNGVYLLD